MKSTHSFTNHFLIAMPSLQDPNFHHSVAYICEHNAEGAMGIVINRPISISLADVLEHMGITFEPNQLVDQPILAGGPAQPDRGFVLHTPGQRWESTLQISDDISITTSQDILEAISRQEGPTQSLVALGYAGWEEGQLEQELKDNVWLSTPATPEILFDVPLEQRWRAAAAGLGVDLDYLSSQIGHA